MALPDLASHYKRERDDSAPQIDLDSLSPGGRRLFSYMYVEVPEAHQINQSETDTDAQNEPETPPTSALPESARPDPQAGDSDNQPAAPLTPPNPVAMRIGPNAQYRQGPDAYSPLWPGQAALNNGKRPGVKSGRFALRSLASALATGAREMVASSANLAPRVPISAVAKSAKSRVKGAYDRSRPWGNNGGQEDAQTESGEGIKLGVLTRLRMNTLDRVILKSLETMGHLGKKVADEAKPFDRDEEGKNHLRKRGWILLGAVALAGLAVANEKFGLAHETQHLAHKAYEGLQNMGQNTHEHVHTTKGSSGQVIQQAPSSTTPSSSTVGNHVPITHEPGIGSHHPTKTQTGLTQHTHHQVAGHDSHKTVEHAKATKVNLHDLTWNVAHQTAPGHETEVISEALMQYGHKAHLINVGGNLQIALWGDHIVNQQEMEAINHIVAGLGPS